MFFRVKSFCLVLLLFVAMILGPQALAQSSGSATGADSAKSATPKQKKRDPGPRKATIMSALAPGLGQIYNRKYWKLPIVYGLGTVLVIYTIKNHNDFKEFEKAHIQRQAFLKGTSTVEDKYFKDPEYQEPNNLKLQRDNFKRFRDLDIIMLAGLYLLQVVDAHVDAHLKNFEINDNLSLDVTPQLKYLPQNNLYSGLSLNFKFKSKRQSF
jgi:hypothetical protein